MYEKLKTSIVNQKHSKFKRYKMLGVTCDICVRFRSLKMTT